MVEKAYKGLQRPKTGYKGLKMDTKAYQDLQRTEKLSEEQKGLLEANSALQLRHPLLEIYHIYFILWLACGTHISAYKITKKVG